MSTKERNRFREVLFHRWTHGLSPLEQRISIFSRIRDIPYAIIPEWRETDDMVQMMITANQGWCGPKHILLAWMFERLGVGIQLATIPFRWQDQPVRYPDTIRACFPYLPDSTHLCCRAFLKGTWRIVDATWDPPLRRAGFPVNDPWDGVSETILAVTPLPGGEREHEPIRPLPEQIQRNVFAHHLNRWFEEVRKKGL